VAKDDGTTEKVYVNQSDIKAAGGGFKGLGVVTKKLEAEINATGSKLIPVALVSIGGLGLLWFAFKKKSPAARFRKKK
jgi:hypothetical protein